MVQLKNEGEVTFIRRTKVHRACWECAEPATVKHTFLLHGARSNPRSSAYGGDDVSWCSDAEAFACDGCAVKVQQAPPEGHSWCATFRLLNEDGTPGRFQHMFLEDKEQVITLDHLDRALGLGNLTVIKDRGTSGHTGPRPAEQLWGVLKVVRG